jgi:hypothetical protein
MRIVHALLTAVDRGTSALATQLHGRPHYRIEKSAMCERCMFAGIVALLLAWGGVQLIFCCEG